MSAPRLLDLFCCEGGAAVGYSRAGCFVLGVDTNRARLSHYPFGWVHHDALSAVERWGHLFDVIHASPPCQAYTRGNAGKVTDWPRLIEPVRELLQATGKPYIIENVADAAPELIDPVALCGCMFDLHTVDTDGVTIHLQRKRLFETNFPLTAPRPCDHSDHEWVAGAYGGARRDKHEAKHVRKGGYVPRDKEVVKRLLGIEHDMTWAGLFECIPPAYTSFIGERLLAWLRSSSETQRGSLPSRIPDTSASLGQETDFLPNMGVPAGNASSEHWRLSGSAVNGVCSPALNRGPDVQV